MNTMSSPQSWAIFCLSKIDARNTALDYDKASTLIGRLKAGGDQFSSAISELKGLPGAVVKGEAKAKADWQTVYNKAHAAGMLAGQGCIPSPMVVQQHAEVFNDASPVVQQWTENEGVCGFAWVTIRPANCSFGLWLKKNNKGGKAYRGGCQVWVGEFNQSMTRKEAYAQAFAEELHNYGIDAHADSRMD